MQGGAAPGGARATPTEVGNAAAELLAQQSERRKRGRPPLSGGGSAGGGSMASSVDSGHGADGHGSAEKKRKPMSAVPTGGSVNVAAAKKAAAALIRESSTYKRLIEVEERIDLAIMRKQQDIKDALKMQSYTTTRTFRLYLFNTYRYQEKVESDEATAGEGQSSEENEKNPDSSATRSTADNPDDTGDVPSWSLRIQGQLLPSPVDPPPDSSPPGSAQRAPVEGGTPGASTTPQAGIVAAEDVAGGAGAAQPPRPRQQSPDPARPELGPQSSPSPSSAQPAAALPRTDSARNAQFTDVFRKIVIELDRDVYPERNLIEWNRTEREPPADGVEISRPGDKEGKVTVFLYVDHKPERFKVSVALSRLVGVRQDTRSGIFMAVWQYIKKMKLQCVDDRTSIRVDNGLKTIMPAGQMEMATVKLQHLFEIVKMHMGPPDPIQIEYQVKLSGNVVDNQHCYDVQVEIPDDGLKESAQAAGIFGLTYPSSAEFVALNDKHLEALEQIAYHKRRREFFEGFCSDPVGFINDLIMSQTRDLKVISGSTGRNPEEERRSAFYQQQWVHEAIPRYLLRKAISDAARKVADGPNESR